MVNEMRSARQWSWPTSIYYQVVEGHIWVDSTVAFFLGSWHFRLSLVEQRKFSCVSLHPSSIFWHSTVA